MAGIVCADYFIPPETLSVRTEIESSDMTDEQKKGKIEYYKTCSIDNISVWGDTDPIRQMELVSDRILADTGVSPDKIRYIFAANPRKTIFGNVNIPFYIKEKFGLVNAEILFLNEVCASSIMSVGLADKLLRDTDEYALLLSLHAMDRHERFRNFTVAGDGLAAALLGNSNEQFRIVDFHAMSYGKSSYNTYISGSEPETGLRIAKIAVNFIKEIYIRNGLQLSDVNRIVAQNTNLMQLNIFTRLLKVPDDYIMIENIAQSGHIGDVDTIRNIKDISGMENGLYLIYASGLYETQDIIFAEALVEKIR